MKDLPLGRKESVNPPKIDIILLLIAHKAISYRSALLLEPVVRLLCLENLPVRKMAFDLLANVQRFYKSKKKSLIQIYLLALNYPNWILRVEVLRLLCLAFHVGDDDTGITAQEAVLGVAKLLDDDVTKVKM